MVSRNVHDTYVVLALTQSYFFSTLAEEVILNEERTTEEERMHILEGMSLELRHGIRGSPKRFTPVRNGLLFIGEARNDPNSR